MGTRITDLHCKEVVCVGDGRRLGFVSDVQVEVPDGCLRAIVVPGPCRIWGLLGRREEYVIPWNCIRRIGPDIILVEIKPEDCCIPKRKMWTF